MAAQHSCLICLRCTSSLNNAIDSRFCQNEHLCRRFSTLESRYLNFNRDNADLSNTLNIGKPFSTTDKHLCDGCIPTAESFCQMYDAWSCLRLKMNHCLEEVSNLILQGSDMEGVGGDTVCRDSSSGQSMPRKGRISMEAIDFRKRLLKHGMQVSSYSHLHLF